MRGDELTSFCDFRSGIRYEYDVPKKKLYRLSADGGAAEELESMEGLFQAIFRGGAIRDGDLFRLRIVKQRQRTVTEQGRRWIQYELELEVQGGGPKPQAEIPPISVVIRVNPEKMLPESATFTRGTSKAAVPGSDSVARGEAKIEIAFDYPAEGPADIYALGVPRTHRWKIACRRRTSPGSSGSSRTTAATLTTILPLPAETTNPGQPPYTSFGARVKSSASTLALATRRT